MAKREKTRKTTVLKTKVCSAEYGVTSLSTTGGARHVHRREPCEQCPWRMDVPTGVFPEEAYRTSAPTAYDMATSTFGCHMSGKTAPATCAGFLLRHGEDNLAVRLSLHGERIDLDTITDGGFPVYETYRHMAIANGVDAQDPVLAPVRGAGEVWDSRARRWGPDTGDE